MIVAADSVNVLVAAFRSPKRAITTAAAIQDGGLPAFTRSQSNGWQVVVVGPYVSVEEARAAQTMLSRQGFADSRIVVEEP
jgi:cell division protein FtsN